MKPSNTRRYRRARRPAKSDGAFFKKESVQEQSFFGESSHDAFFRPTLSSVVPPVQRKCDHCAEEEKTQRKEDKKEEEKKLQRVKGDKEEKEKKLMRAPDKKEEDDKKLQRATDKKEEDDKKLQRAPDKKEEEDKKPVQKKEATGSAPTTSVSSYVGSLSGGGQSLPHQTKQFFSARMGYDFSNVKVHTDKEAAESAKDINAKAYTTGNHIVFNDGQYNDGSTEGKKLLAHELVHVIQQDDGTLQRKGEEEEPECTAGSVDLEAETIAGFNKGAGTMAKEKTVKSKGCDGCEEECVSITGTLVVPFKVSTQINLPTVPPGLTECQQERVQAAINGPLTVHEKKHVKAFETFNGTAALPVNFKGCESDYISFQENLAETEFQRREAAAKAKSAKLDPFSVPVDLCCKDKPKK